MDKEWIRNTKYDSKVSLPSRVQMNKRKQMISED